MSNNMSDIMFSEYVCTGKVEKSPLCPNNLNIPYHMPAGKYAKDQIRDYLRSNDKNDLKGTCFYHIVASSKSGIRCPTLKDSLTWVPSDSGWTVDNAVLYPTAFLNAVLDFAD